MLNAVVTPGSYATQLVNNMQISGNLNRYM